MCSHRDFFTHLTMLRAVGRGKDVLALHLHPLNFSLMMLVEEALDCADLGVQLVSLIAGSGRLRLTARLWLGLGRR